MKNSSLKICLSFFILSLIILTNISAQSAFHYQAVARDNLGAAIANQTIGIQISIIQIDETLPPVYIETHEMISNDYGVFTLNIGEGDTQEGLFDEIDWSQNSFIKVELDLDGGRNYNLNSLSKILAVPYALYAERAKQIDGKGFGLSVIDFGAKGDGTTDDTEAFELGLVEAELLGCKLFVPNGIYRITKTLKVGSGVSLIGEGIGSTPLETPHNGSLIWFEGNGYAIKVIGHNSRLEDLVIKDKSDGNANGCIKLEANGYLLESVYLSEILISGFVDGTGLKLAATNEGGIAYASFNNVRVRHGKIGFHITQDNSSFVNSNTWNHCQISGGGFEYGFRINGGNNNILNGVVIEPPSTTKGHLVVNKGEIFGSEIRIEGVNQEETVPLILFKKNTKNSTLTGVYAGGLTLDKGNNLIDMRSGKAIHYRNSSFNKFRNAAFSSADNVSISDWEVDGNGVTMETLAPELSAIHNVLKLTVPAGITAILEPTPSARPEIKDLPLYDQVNFGFHVKSQKQGVIFTSTNAPNGWTNSSSHSGSNEWEFVGMNAEVNRNKTARFTLKVQNTTSSDMVFYVTTPTLNFGNQLPTIDESPLFESGGQLTGLLSHAISVVSIPNNGFLMIPQNANYFEVTNINNIHRLNHKTADHFSRGSVVTLLFNEAGIGVTNGAYINLISGYNSVVNGSLTLISNGNGTWREVSRNN